MTLLHRHHRTSTDADTAYAHEKDTADIKEIEDISTDIDNPEEVIRAEHEFTPKEYRRLLWKIDICIMPFLMLVYGLQYMDKMSLSSGVIFGLKEDTKLVGNEYANLTAFYYMSYFLAQLPMQWVLQRFWFGRILSLCVIIWGGLVMCLAACNSYAPLAVLRVLMGWFESVVTPAFAFLTASWYLKNEQTLRQAIYYSMNHILALILNVGIYYIALDAKKSGKIAGWRVINLFLGGVTVFVGLVMIVFVGHPNEVWWLSKREKMMAHARIVSNGTGGSESHKWKWEQVKECLTDPSFWHANLVNFLSCIPNGAITTFQYIVFQSFGFSNFDTILYSLPMNGINVIMLLGCGTLAYFWPWLRFPLVITSQIVGAAVWMYVGLAPESTSTWALWGVFLFCNVFILALMGLWPLMSINVAGRTKKSFTGACCFMSYCVGNIVGSQIFIPKDKPRYRHGLVTCSIILILNAVNCTLWMIHYKGANRKRDRELVASGKTEEDREYENRVAGESDLTDIENQHFRYSV